MYADEPGSPPCVLTVTFGACPASAETMFCDSLDRLIADESTELITVPIFSAVFEVPAPVTITTPSCSGLDSSTKSCVIEPASVMVTLFAL